MIRKILYLLAISSCALATDYKVVQEVHNPDVNQMIYDGLEEFNMGFFQEKDHTMKLDTFTIYAQDDDGTIIGGICGYTFECEKLQHPYLQVDLAWVKESRRGEGVATRLFKQAEGFAKERNCKYMQLFTWAYQAVGFYEKLGFERLGVIPQWITQYDAVFFRKSVE